MPRNGPQPRIGKAQSVSRCEVTTTAQIDVNRCRGRGGDRRERALGRLHCHKAKSGIGVFVDDQSKTVRPPGIKQKVCHVGARTIAHTRGSPRLYASKARTRASPSILSVFARRRRPDVAIEAGSTTWLSTPLSCSNRWIQKPSRPAS